MLRIEEIVGAMDDEFRYSLDALSDEKLAALAADKAALRRLRPVGVSNAEALAMIVAIQDKREKARNAPPTKPKNRAPRARPRSWSSRGQNQSQSPNHPSPPYRPLRPVCLLRPKPLACRRPRPTAQPSAWDRRRRTDRC